MNIKFSQLPITIDSQGTDLFPILRDGENQMTPVSAVYTFLSGNKLIDIYTSYSSISSQYILTTSPSAITWNSTTEQVNRSSGAWDAVATAFEQVSAVFPYIMLSNPTLVPNSSAIQNIVSITQVNYDYLVTNNLVQESTFYIIA